MDIRARLIEQADYMETDTPIVIETDSLVWHQVIALLREAAAALPTGSPQAPKPMPQYAVLGIGAEAWAELLQIEATGIRRCYAPTSGAVIEWHTFQAVMSALRSVKVPTGSPQADDYLSQVADRIIETDGCVANDWLVGVAKELKRRASRPTGSETPPVEPAVRTSDPEQSGWDAVDRMLRACPAPSHVELCALASQIAAWRRSQDEREAGRSEPPLFLGFIYLTPSADLT